MEKLLQEHVTRGVFPQKNENDKTIFTKISNCLASIMKQFHIQSLLLYDGE